MSGWRSSLPPREVTLVLCRRDGSVVGALPPYEVALPWWQEVGPVVDGALANHGVAVIVLRLLDAVANEHGAGGPVTYLAEVDDGWLPPTHPWEGAPPDADEPRRASWARPGGPAADLAWADAVLVERGRPRTGPARQVRTWNLSSLWRLPTGDGAAWLKVVPPFFAHEGAALARLDPAVIPPLLATEGPRVLLDEVPGEDQYEATGDTLVRMVDLLVDLQAGWIGRTGELLAIGAPDWRAGPLTVLLSDLVERLTPEVDRSVAARVASLVADLPARFAEIAACGLPDTLVHGDFHRGNVRGTRTSLVLLDWGDCGIGNPMLDQAAFLNRLPRADQERVRPAWSAAWQERLPGCDPARAAELLAPVAALRQALIYQVFLDAIEPREQIYHAADPGIWLTRAAELVEAAPAS